MTKRFELYIPADGSKVYKLEAVGTWDEMGKECSRLLGNGIYKGLTVIPEGFVPQNIKEIQEDELNKYLEESNSGKRFGQV